MNVFSAYRSHVFVYFGFLGANIDVIVCCCRKSFADHKEDVKEVNGFCSRKQNPAQAPRHAYIMGSVAKTPTKKERTTRANKHMHLFG